MIDMDYPTEEAYGEDMPRKENRVASEIDEEIYENEGNLDPMADE